MYAYFKRDGTIKLKPMDHGEAMAMKALVKELQTHGVKMLDIDTDYEETPAYGRPIDQSMPHGTMMMRQPYPAYGYAMPTRGPYWPPEMSHDVIYRGGGAEYYPGQENIPGGDYNRVDSRRDDYDGNHSPDIGPNGRPPVRRR